MLFRIVGCVLLLMGIGAVVVPFLVAAPDDSPFLGALPKSGPLLNVSHGRIVTGGRSYKVEIEDKPAFTKDGRIASIEATLRAIDEAGEVKVYRRMRYFHEGFVTETLEETPTRTTTKGRGPTGNEKYREVVLIDNSPLLTRPPVRWGVVAGGGALCIAGIGLFLLSFLRRRRT